MLSCFGMRLFICNIIHFFFIFKIKVVFLVVLSKLCLILFLYLTDITKNYFITSNQFDIAMLNGRLFKQLLLIELVILSINTTSCTLY